jgi:hypothetical protein
MLIAPPTVNELLPLIVRVVFADTVLAQVSEEHTAAVSTVTLMPLFMLTVSLDVGTALPPHVVVELQLPVTLAVLVAALAVEGAKSAATSARSGSVRRARRGERRKAERGTPHSAVCTPHFAADGVGGAKSSFFIAPLFISSLPRWQLISR